MTTAAIILADSPHAESRIAALPLIDRLLVATARSGFAPITIIASKALCLPRSEAWQIPKTVLENAEDALRKIQGPTLVLTSSVYFDA